MSSLTKKVAFGAAWMMTMRLSMRLIGLISTLILVRLLSPSDFGVVAMAMTIVASVELLTSFGFDIAIIQNQQATEDDYNTAWSLNVLLGCGAGLLLFILAYPAATFYGVDELARVYQVLAIASIAQGAENIGLVDYRKHLEFRKEFVFRILVKSISFVATISLALLLRSYWALVIGIVFSRVLATFLSYTIHPFRPRWSFAAISKIMNFSKWLFLNNLTYTLRFSGPSFVIGKIAGAKSLGLYSVAYEISNLPTTELVAPVNRVLMPAFSKISTELERARNSFLLITALLAIISLPTGLGIAATADLFTPVVLGQKWVATISLIKILAIFGAVMAVQSPITTILIALGKPKAVSLLSVLNVICMLPAMIYGTRVAGAQGASIALLATATIFLPIYYITIGKAISLSILDIGKIFIRPLLASVTMYLVVTQQFSGAAANILNFILAASVGAIVFTITLTLLWILSGKPNGSAESYLLTTVTNFVNKRFGNRKINP